MGYVILLQLMAALFFGALAMVVGRTSLLGGKQLTVAVVCACALALLVLLLTVFG
jgi:hypothetical protein